MFWTGYIYRCISIRYNLLSRAVYKLFNGREIVKYCNICHTYDIVDAAERMMESISYDDSLIQENAYRPIKKLLTKITEQ